MINTSIAQKMRQIAGYIYGALFIFEVLTLYYVLIGMALTGVPLAVLVELLVLPLAATACVLCIAGRVPLSDAPVRGAVIGTALMVVFELITVRIQVNLIASSMSALLPSAPQTGTAQMTHYVLFAVRLVLMILAAFFLTSARDGGESDEVYEEDEADEEEAANDVEKEDELEEKTEEIKKSAEKAEDEAQKVDDDAEEDAPEDKKDEE